MVTPERMLWQAVVHKAFLDALCPKENQNSADQVKATREAIVWIERGGKDFQQVCSMAGMDPDFLREAYLRGRMNWADIGPKPKSRKRQEAAE